MATQGVGMATGVTSFRIGQRRLRNQRAHARLLGLVLQEDDLLLGDGQLGSETLEPVGRIHETPLQE